jgi:hypothetical protein
MNAWTTSNRFPLYAYIRMGMRMRAQLMKTILNIVITICELFHISIVCWTHKPVFYRLDTAKKPAAQMSRGSVPLSSELFPPG